MHHITSPADASRACQRPDVTDDRAIRPYPPHAARGNVVLARRGQELNIPEIASRDGASGDHINGRDVRDAGNAEREAVAILGRLGIAEKRLGRPVEQMIRGMQQKVAIARAC